MPRPCAVEVHVRVYTRKRSFLRCHGLVPWSFTLVSIVVTLDATALCRGGSRSCLHPEALFPEMPRPCAVELHARFYSGYSRCHGLVPWRFTFVSTPGSALS